MLVCYSALYVYVCVVSVCVMCNSALCECVVCMCDMCVRACLCGGKGVRLPGCTTASLYIVCGSRLVNTRS